jgi:signal transduction histidine kinase
LWPVLWGRLDNRFYDFFAAKRPAPQWRDVAVVEIDRATVRDLFAAPVFPLSRHVRQHASLVLKLSQAGARAIVLDLRLDPDVFDGAPGELAEAMKRAGNVYLVTSLGIRARGGGGEVVGADMPHPLLSAAAAGVLLADVTVDADGVLRRFEPDPAAIALGLETVPEALSNRKAPHPVPIEFPTSDSPLPRVSYVKVLNDPGAAEDVAGGRIVFVGSVLDDVADTVVIPHQRRSDGTRSPLLPGIHALAATTQTLINGAPVRDASWPVALLWNLVWIAIVIVAMQGRRPLGAVAILFTVAIVAMVATGTLHVFAGLVPPAGLLWGTIGLVGGFTLVDEYIQTRRELYAVLKRSHDELEEEVAKRTAELRLANAELEDALIRVRETQAQLVQSEKMASLGNLVAGVAHEINNPVGAIAAALDTSRRCIDKLQSTAAHGGSGAPLERTLGIMRESLASADQAGRRVATIVRSLKNFARLDEAEFQEVNIHEGLNSALTLLEHEMGQGVEIVRDYGDIPPVRCYARELNQAFMNVLRNAVQAVEEAGKIAITTRATGESATVRIDDSGPGIPSDVLPRVFDPGFTTRGVGVGTGLGLAIAYNVIRKHGGDIGVECGENGGTTVTISIPMSVTPVGH